MSGLITMLLSTLGATGMGSMLKILGGIAQNVSAAKEQAAKRELVRDMAMHKADVDFQKAVFGDANADHGMFTRHTRRLIALIGMSNFAAISILCTLFPGVELVTFTPPESKEAFTFLWGLVKVPYGTDITTTITTGHISLVSVATLGAIVGFYFTPGGK